MPKSRKPRKAYHPKPIAMPLRFSPMKVEQIKTLFESIETRILLKLREGQCEIDEMRCVRDVFNVTLFTMMHRLNEFTDGWPLQEISEQILQAGIDTAHTIERAKRIGHVVCTGDEIGSICDTLEACTRFCRDQLEQCPGIFAVEMNASKVITDANEGRIRVTKKLVDMVYDRCMSITHMPADAQVTAFEKLRRQVARGQIGRIERVSVEG